MAATRPRIAQGAWIALLAVSLALSFLGARGIWDPDEGRYTNVALNMLDSGDWLNPKRNEDVGHWTKPPLTYWAIAASVGVFGPTPWAARLPAALAYLLSAWLAWRIARRLAPGTEAAAATIYATMLFPFGASQFITTDYVLAACESLAMWGFVEARFGKSGDGREARRASAWLTVMWAGFALAFLAKGPPGLLPLLVVLLFDALMPGRATHRALQLSGLAVFAVLALPWYIAVIHGHPGLLAYFVGNEVVHRITTNDFGRHGEWYGWVYVYVPTLLVGTLPWTPALWRWARALPAAVRRWRDSAARGAQAGDVLLALWIVLPLVVFCASRSRLPLYVLPLFLPLAVAAAARRRGEGRALPRWPTLAAWAGVLLALKLASAYWPTHKDAAAWAAAIRERVPGPYEDVLFVEDMARYGLHLHLGAEIERIVLDPQPRAAFNPDWDETLLQELAENETHGVWVARQERWAELQARVAALGYDALAMGAPYEGRVIFVTRRRPRR